MKRLLLLITLLLFSISSQAKESIKEGKEYPIEKIREQNKMIIQMAVEEISKKLPQKVDKYTTLVEVSDDNLTLIYSFEINSSVKSDEAIIKEDKERMKRVITKGICQSSKRFLDAGVSLKYAYLGASSKKELFAFTMNQKKCKELD